MASIDKKYVLDINSTTGEQVTREFTAEEYAQAEIDAQNAIENASARQAEIERIETLKVSAKAKLIAGEPLTAEEADTLVI